MIQFYCTIGQYEQLKRALEKSGAVIKESEGGLSDAVQEWADRLAEDTDEQESLYEQISKYNHGKVE